ncbi:MAG: MBOAT family protein [Roseburia sp.]|nr:MBOAT family protein [Roseburia sp.]
MNFNSYIFLFLFLPLTIGIYFLLQEKGKNRAAKIWLFGMSLWFYGYFNYSYLILIAISIVCNYVLSFTMAHFFEKKALRKILLVIGLALNLGMIFYFKYHDFFFENVNAVFGTSFTLRHILLPLGISFYTFQQLSFVIDSYKEKVEYSFVDYGLFVTFFPQLVAGPIVLHTELVPQIQDEKRFKINYENLCKGITIFTIGLSKKVLIADYLGKVVDWGFSEVSTITSIEAIVVMLSYTLQIYFDFSGYSDMAIGLGKMFNFDLPMNFNSPYKACSIIDFWKRWHMTLTRFLRTYIYFPLGGSRKGVACTYRNILVVFLASGLWHGANWTFILWGLLHGVAEILQKVFQKTWDKIAKPLQWAINFVFLVVTWTLFRADSIGQAGLMISRVFKGEKFAIVSEEVSLLYIVFLLVTLVVAVVGKNLSEWKLKMTNRLVAAVVILLVLCILQFEKVSPFLYFNF